MPVCRFWCVKMKLLKLVPLFVLLVTVVSLMPPAYATGNLNSSRSNIYRVTCSGTGEVTGTATITLNKDGHLLNSIVARCSTTSKTVISTPLIGVEITNESPNGYQVAIVGQSNEGGNLSSYSCNLHGSITPNIPVPVQCTIPNSHAVVFVTITTA